MFLPCGGAGGGDCPPGPGNGASLPVWGVAWDMRRPGERVFPGPSVKCGCGGVLLSHVLSGIVPSPCQGLASGFGMGPGVSPGPWPPQNSVILRSGGGLGTGSWTRVLRDVGVRAAMMMPPGLSWLVSWWCWLSSTVSAGRLHPSRGFHVRSINHMFSMGSHTPPRGGVRNPYLGAGFPLRCFQRLSLPNVANQPCPWRDNWHTRGSSTQVLSYYGQASSGFQRAQRIETKLSHDVLNPARVPL